MLQTKPTEHLTGVTIQGDFNDFYDLVESIYRMTGLEDDPTRAYYGVSSRLLGVCYDIRHAFMGDRDIVLKDNGMNEEIMKWHEKIVPTQNVYYSVNILFPEAIFLADNVPKMYIYSSKNYGVKRLRTKRGLPTIYYGNYVRDKANLDVLCAGIWQALGMAIGEEELEKLLRLEKNSYESCIDYVTQYIDKRNVELLKTDVSKRKDKLKNIARRIIKKPQAYFNMEKRFKYWAEEYKVSMYELKDPGIEYPEDFEW